MRDRRILVRAPAKINLVLRVGPLRPDGFHALASLFQAVSLFDTVSITPAVDISVTVSGAQADQVPTDGSNLAVKAAMLLADTAGVSSGARIHITKGIPVAGGMAGGSADAAAALVGCDALWRTGFARNELSELAAELGSDVPFSLVGGTAIGTGRGEQLSPTLTRGTLNWVLALPAGALSTPAVFREFDRLAADRDAPQPEVAPAIISALRTGDLAGIAAGLANDLQEPAIRMQPDLAETLRRGLDDGAMAAIVSGSGPTVAFLQDSPDRDLPSVKSASVRGLMHCHGPVPGARLVEPVFGPG